ncbi:MAG TPA: BTAD domain-containing putative transcriptional regulator [Pseudonocardiaceae bacterium]
MPNGTIDADRFERLTTEGQSQLSAGQLETAAKTLRQALGMWSGRALSGVSTGPLLQAEVVRMEELRKIAFGHRVEVDLQLGRHAELIGELTTLVAQQPTHEGFSAKLILGLYRAGRRSEALQQYQRTRAALAKELGLEPSAELRKLQQAILSSDPSLDAPANGIATVRAVPKNDPPNQLPLDVPPLVGRDDLVSSFVRSIRPKGHPTVPVGLIVGPPGAGKSAFAVHVAHRLRENYPDGVLYAKLLGSGGAVVRPEPVLAGFLQALGMPAERTNAGLDELVRMFRSWTGRRKVLVVLDDVVDAHQLHPLLPGGVGCAVIVASRRLLSQPSIVSTVRVGRLDAASSRQMLTDLLGADRIGSNARELDELIELCGDLPMVLRSAAKLLQLRPHWSVNRLLARVRGDVHRMSMLSADEPGISESVERSYRLLPVADQRALQAVARDGVHPVSLPEAAALLGVDEEAAEVLLEDLVESQLADVVDNDEDGFRYVIPPLYRAIVQTLAGDSVPRQGPNTPKALRGLGRLDELATVSA